MLLMAAVGLFLTPIVGAVTGTGQYGEDDDAPTLARKTADYTNAYSRCNAITDDDEKVACLKKINSEGNTDYKRCNAVAISNRDDCQKQLQDQVTSDLPFVKKRECLVITNEKSRKKCLDEFAGTEGAAPKIASAVSGVITKCNDLDSADKKKCLLALKVATTHAYDVAPGVAECQRTSDNAEDVRNCVKRFGLAIKDVEIDCSVFEDDTAKSRCETCKDLDSVGKKSSCLKELNACLATSSGQAADTAAVKQCARELDENHARESACVNAVDLKTCYHEQFQVGQVDCLDAVDLVACQKENRNRVSQYVKFRMSKMSEGINRLYESGYLTEEQIKEAQEYVESQKEAFAAAGTLKKKKDVVSDVREKWSDAKNRLATHWKNAVKERVQAIKQTIRRLKAIKVRLEEAGYAVERLDAAITRGENLLTKIEEAETLPQLRVSIKNALTWMHYVKKVLIAVKNKSTMPGEPELEPDVTPSATPTIAAPTPTLDADDDKPSPTPQPADLLGGNGV